MTGLPDRVTTALRGVARPLWLRARHRVEALIHERVAPVAEESARATAELHTRLNDQQAQIRILSTDLADGLREADARLREVAAGLEWLDHEHRRIAPQLAAVEARLAELERQATRRTAESDPRPAPTLTSLVEELRAEHSRVRARLGTVTRYEERLARLESGLA